MEESFIKLFRKISEWRWYKEGATKDVFIHLLINAKYRETQYMDIIIHRGQLTTTYRKLAEETGLTLQQVRTAIARLKSTQEITCISHGKFSLITVNNYDRYQTSNTESNISVTRQQHANNSQLTTTKENKELKNERKKENTDSYYLKSYKV